MADAIIVSNLKIVPQEIFKDVGGFEGYYLVSNLGRIISLRNTRGRLKKSPTVIKSWIDGKNKRGYDTVILHKDGKGIRFKIHRLVAQAFLPNPLNLPEVNHKDENKRNNRADNLEWCDRKYNVNYGTFKQRVVRSRGIKVSNLETNKSLYFASELILNQFLGFTQRIVRECCNGKRESAYGCKFKFMEK